MPQLLTPPNPSPRPVKASSAYVGGLVLYLLAIGLPVALKLLHRTRVAAWPWAKVLAPVWVPWAVLGLLVALGWGLYLLQGGRRG